MIFIDIIVNRPMMASMVFFFETYFDIKPFQSDYSLTEQGVRLLMECKVPQPSTPDAFDIYGSQTDLEEVTGGPDPPELDGECTFVEDTSGAIFDTGEPYLNRMRKGINIWDAYSLTCI